MAQIFLRVALVGAGAAADYQAKAFRHTAGCRVVAVCSRDERTGRSFCRRHGIAAWYADLSQMIERERVEAVVICTPTGSHAEIARLCLEMGCHVLLEKPLALTVAQADLVVASAEHAGRVCMVSAPLLFSREYRAVKRVLDAGRLGELRTLWLVKGKWLPPQAWYCDPASSNGVAHELSVHGIELFKWLAGGEIDSLDLEYAPGAYRPELADTAFVTVRFKNGTLGMIGNSYSFPFFGSCFGMVGTGAALRLVRGKPLVEELSGGQTLLQSFMKYCLESFILPWRTLLEKPFHGQARHFIDCVAGKSTPLVSVQSARDTLFQLENATRRGFAQALPPPGSP